MSASSNCEICTLKYIKTRYEVKCPLCEFVCCAQCVARYHTSKSTHPQCMSCGKGWTSEQVGTLLTKKSHITDVFNSRNELLYQDQLRLLPEVQPCLQAISNCEESLKQVNLRHIEVQKAQRVLTEMRTLEARASRDLQEKQRELRRLKKMIIKEDQEETSVLARRCFSTSCEGWTRPNEKCTLCSKFACFKCMKSVDTIEGHVCSNDDLLSARSIRENSKECPTCQTFISKDSGCNDMFCVVCKTTFNYRTGIIDKRGNSNPIFHEWLRSLGIQRPEDRRTIQGDNFTLTHIINRPRYKELMSNLVQHQEFMRGFKMLDTLIRKIPNLGNENGNIKLNLLNLRINHIRNPERSDTMFKREISRVFRDFEKDQALSQLKDNAMQVYRTMLERSFNAEELHEFLAVSADVKEFNTTFEQNIKKVKSMYGYNIVIPAAASSTTTNTQAVQAS